jgi:hypothetical protein
MDLTLTIPHSLTAPGLSTTIWKKLSMSRGWQGTIIGVQTQGATSEDDRKEKGYESNKQKGVKVKILQKFCCIS